MRKKPWIRIRKKRIRIRNTAFGGTLLSLIIFSGRCLSSSTMRAAVPCRLDRTWQWMRRSTPTGGGAWLSSNISRRSQPSMASFSSPWETASMLTSTGRVHRFCFKLLFLVTKCFLLQQKSFSSLICVLRKFFILKRRTLSKGHTSTPESPRQSPLSTTSKVIYIQI